MVPTPSRGSFGLTGTAVRWERHRRGTGAGGAARSRYGSYS